METLRAESPDEGLETRDSEIDSDCQPSPSPVVDYGPVDAADFSASAFPDAERALTGRSVTLEVLHRGHAADLAAAFHVGDAAHASTWSYLPYGPFHDLASLEAHVDAFVAAGRAGRLAPYAVVTRDAGTGARGRALGICAYLDIRGADGSIEIGHLAFGTRLRRTRAASEAIYLLLRHAFQELRYRRVVWKCDSANEPSKAAARRYGFRDEGTWRKATVVKGRNRDTTWLAIVDDDWLATRAVFDAWLSEGNFDASGTQIRKMQDIATCIHTIS